MIRVNQLKMNLSSNDENIEKYLLKALKIKKEQLVSFEIIKKSIDARKKDDIKYVYCVDAIIKDEKKYLIKNSNNNITKIESNTYDFVPKGNCKLKNRPVIVGCGPAGLFCGYMLAKNGYNPIIVERGLETEKRIKKVNIFWNTGILDTECNVQFGEGGAGTFSDGKLNTLIKDAQGRGKLVLKTFAEFGAPAEIMYLNKPHIGTDKLTTIVENMRKEIIKLGGEVRFSSKVTDIVIDDNRVKSLIINNSIKIDTDVVVFAIGHSARDTFKVIYDKGFMMSRKSFAIGVRIEHNQEMISKAMYSSSYDKLPPADYKLTYQTSSNRGIYSFCMCPGGFVVNASSENNHLAINGMSNYNRNEKNSNAALVVTVNPEDFYSDYPLAGVDFQRKWEEAAYRIGDSKVPVQLFGDFKRNKISTSIGDIEPNIKGEYKFADINNALPSYVCEAIKEGMDVFDRKIKGYANPEAVLSGVETRTSSPVRIERNEKFESNIRGVYPCGEGAGYAGGITSAAVDGIKVFEAIANKYYI